MGIYDGKVVFITGAARGVGRTNALRFAVEGADVIVTDFSRKIDSVAYPLATRSDLDETALEIEALGRRVYAAEADVRDPDAVARAFDEGASRLGPVGVVVANAGIAAMAATDSTPRDQWQKVIDVNLTGVFNTIEAARPSMVDHGEGGSIVIMSSTAGLAGIGTEDAGSLAYAASKHGVVGLMRTYANLLAPHSIRVNSVHPTGIATPMIKNEFMDKLIEDDPTVAAAFANALPVSLIEPQDVTNAIVWLCSDEARYVTGVTLPVDAGALNKR